MLRKKHFHTMKQTNKEEDMRKKLFATDTGCTSEARLRSDQYTAVKRHPPKQRPVDGTAPWYCTRCVQRDVWAAREKTKQNKHDRWDMERLPRVLLARGNGTHLRNTESKSKKKKRKESSNY